MRVAGGCRDPGVPGKPGGDRISAPHRRPGCHPGPQLYLLAQLQRRQGHCHFGRRAGRAGAVGVVGHPEPLDHSLRADSLRLGRFPGCLVYAALRDLVHDEKLEADHRHRRDERAGDLQAQGQHSAVAEWNRKPHRRIEKTIHPMKVTVLGVGAWGTALGKLLQESRHCVTLWGHNPQHLDQIRRSGRNEPYLPGIDLPRDWRLETDPTKAVHDSECVVVAVPSKAFREVTRCLANFAGMAVSVTKGIEHDTGLTMCGVLRENAPHSKVAALSGPSLAWEVARGIPTAIVAASTDIQTAPRVQELFHRPAFRVYTSTDLLGVELGGALKNVIAIAAGVSDGLGFGDNSKAALITRANVEIRRLGEGLGGPTVTFSGLSGLGDLTVNCFSRLSRNRGFGERLGRGEQVADIVASMVNVAEGYPTRRPAWQLAHKLNVATPIIDEV